MCQNFQIGTICVKTACILSSRFSKPNPIELTNKKMTNNIDFLMVTCLSPRNMDLYKSDLRKAWIV